MSWYLITKINSHIGDKGLKLKFGNKEEDNIFISKTLCKIINKTKESITEHYDEWDIHKKITNPYEYIHTNVPNKNISISKLKPISRAFYKLIEIVECMNLLKNYEHSPMKSFHLAEGPGGFIEAMTFLRKNEKDRYYGMTLIDDENENVPGWRKSKLFLQNNRKVVIEKGADGCGDLYNPVNFLHICKNYKNSMDLITGDGGFDFSVDYNNQETMASRLILTQIFYAIAMQKQGGNFVLKIFDTFKKVSIHILYLLSSLYEKVYIFKPNTSRIANSEKYIVCCNFKIADSSYLFTKIFNILHVLNNLKMQNVIIKEILDVKVNITFLKSIEEINAIIGQQQISNILSTLRIIQNKEKKGEKFNLLKNKHIKKCIQWCSKYNIPCNKLGITNNVFLSASK